MVGQTRDCGCGCKGGLLERPRYYSRQLVTPDDLNLQQEYFRRKLRLHNLMLHGWGVVCGVEVFRACKPKAQWSDPGIPEYEDWKVKIKPGYVIGPCGDDIWIQGEHEYDIRSCGFLSAPGAPPEQAGDVWCSDVQQSFPDGPVFVAVRYHELTIRPVRTQPTGCGCDETQCEYSRWRDCYQFCTLRECPESHELAPSANPFAGVNPTCPSTCCENPWVVLGEVTITSNGIHAIDSCKCRRLVASFGHLWWSCQDKTDKDSMAVNHDELEALDKYSLTDLEGIGGGRRELIKGVGIRSVRDILTKAATASQRMELAANGGLGIKVLEKIAAHADLMRIDGIGPEYAELLERAGVNSVRKLASRDAKTLLKSMQKVKSATGRRVVRDLPVETEVADWIADAQELKPYTDF
jgi:predicted flap endonuclease-1-like 5' DNA nuclease